MELALFHNGATCPLRLPVDLSSQSPGALGRGHEFVALPPVASDHHSPPPVSKFSILSVSPPISRFVFFNLCSLLRDTEAFYANLLIAMVVFTLFISNVFSP